VIQFFRHVLLNDSQIGDLSFLTWEIEKILLEPGQGIMGGD
jgi:hypothetical protein